MAKNLKMKIKKLERRKNRSKKLNDRLKTKKKMPKDEVMTLISSEVDKMLQTCKDTRKDIDNIVATNPEDVTTKLQVDAGIQYVENKLLEIKDSLIQMKEDVNKNDLDAISEFMKICSDLESLVINDLKQISTIVAHLKNGDHVELKFEETKENNDAVVKSE